MRYFDTNLIERLFLIPERNINKYVWYRCCLFQIGTGCLLTVLVLLNVRRHMETYVTGVIMTFEVETFDSERGNRVHAHACKETFVQGLPKVMNTLLHHQVCRRAVV